MTTTVKCQHYRSMMGPALEDKQGFTIRGCDPAGTYTLHRCSGCGQDLWDYEFQYDKKVQTSIRSKLT